MTEDYKTRKKLIKQTKEIGVEKSDKMGNNIFLNLMLITKGKRDGFNK